MENARIIKLSAPLTVTSANFEEAFGEFSEARGRIRKALSRSERTKRKLERVQNRREVQAARREARNERAQGRIANRAARKSSRQEMRASQQEARQTRKDVRAQRRAERDKLGNEQEQEMDEQTSTEMGDGSTAPSGEDETTGQDGIGEEQPTGEDEMPGEGESETTEDSDITSAEEEAAENGEYFDGFDGSNTEGINYEDLGSLDEVYAMQDDDFYSFDGDTFDSANGKTTRVRRKARIHPKVKKTAMKSEWNKELVSRLQAQANKISDILATQPIDESKAKALGIHRAKLQEAITLHKDRATGFDGMLSDYMNATGEYDNAEGEYESADGEYSEAKGKKSSAKSEKRAAKKGSKKVSKTEKKRRKAEVRAAKKSARKARATVRKSNRMAKKAARRNLTEVEQGLDPQISENRIEIPAESLNYGGNPDTIEKESSATGIIAIDDANDYNAPTEYQYSSANGLKNVNWKGVLIGVGIAAVVIYGAKKAKLF
jgi:hypothetical protein